MDRITFNIQNLSALLKRKPRGKARHIMAGVYLMPGVAYGADRYRAIGVPTDYDGPPLFMEWCAAEHLDTHNRLRIDGSKVYLNGVPIPASTDEYQTRPIRVVTDKKYVASFTVSRGDMLRALKQLGRCKLIGVAVRGDKAIVYTNDDGKESRACSIPCQKEGDPALLGLQKQHLSHAAMLPSTYLKVEFQESHTEGECAWHSVRFTAGDVVEYIVPAPLLNPEAAPAA